MNNSYLGDNVENHDRLQSKVNDISERIEKKRSHYQNMKNKVDKLTELNNKLTNGYELSLKMVVDVSKLLTNYTKMFDDLDKLLGNLDEDMDVQQNDIKYISNLTKESINKISHDFNQQFPTVLKALEKTNRTESMSYAKRLKTIVTELPYDAKKITMNGGTRKVHLK
jgi:predicted nuclease with TOPRIM domain